MSKLSTLRHLVKYFLIGLTVCIVLVAAGLWAYQMYYTSLPLLVPTHPDLVSQTDIKTTAMPLEEAKKIREPISTKNYTDSDFYYLATLTPDQAHGSIDGKTTSIKKDWVISVRFWPGVNSPEVLPSIPKLWHYQCCDSEFMQIARSDLKKIPFWKKYRLVSEISYNGALTFYNGAYYDPSLLNFPLPQNIPVRIVPPDENEYYTIYVNCSERKCTGEELKELYKKYDFSAIEDLEPSQINTYSFYFGTFIVATENQLKKAMQANDITWYQRYDRSHWRQHYPEEDDMDKSFPIQITTYLPDDMSETEKTQEHQRIEDLVRSYGGRTFEEAKELGLRNGSFRYNKSEESKLLVDKDANSKLEYKRDGAEPFESFLYRKNIHDYIVADFPADKVWELMQDPDILRINKADVTQNRAGHPESGLL